MRLAQAEKSQAVATDREHQQTALACMADQAAADGDIRKTYQIVRRLWGCSPPSLAGTRFAKGEVAVSEAPAQERREAPLTELSIGDLRQEITHPPPPLRPDHKRVPDAHPEPGNARDRVSQVPRTTYQEQQGGRPRRLADRGIQTKNSCMACRSRCGMPLVTSRLATSRKLSNMSPRRMS